MRTQLCGAHQVTPVLAALAAGIAMDVPLEAAVRAVEAVPPLDRRLCPVSHPRGFTIVRDMGMLHYHDVTSVRFAEKAAAAGVDGMIAIGGGGGGHAGTISHLVLIPKIREMFAGTIVMAAAVRFGVANGWPSAAGGPPLRLGFQGGGFTRSIDPGGSDGRAPEGRDGRSPLPG